MSNGIVFSKVVGFKGVSKTETLIYYVLLKPLPEILKNGFSSQNCKTWALQKISYFQTSYVQNSKRKVCIFLLVIGLDCH